MTSEEVKVSVVRRRTRVLAGLGSADYVILGLPADWAFTPSD